MGKQFEFSQQTITAEQAIFEALGAASVAWEQTPQGVFDSTRAKAIGEALVAKLEELAPVPVGHHPADFGDEVRAERARHASLGYSTEHDDELGPAHLAREAFNRIGHMGEFSSPGAARHEFVVVASLLWAAADYVDRATRL